jgi:ATP-binding cassette subfamily C exporter for protease/lipase
MSRAEALDGNAMPADRVDMARAGVRPWLIKALVASLAVNLLILTPTLYMLQLYERVLYSMNTLTLLAVSVMAALLLAMMGYADGLRGIWLAGAASSFQQRLQGPLFEAGWRAGLGTTGGDGIGWQRELAGLRSFIAGPGCSALLDLPWTPIYIAVTWLLHPVLGVAVLCFVLLQALLAWQGYARSLTSAKAVQSAASSEAAFTFRKFRHADTIDALGMAPALRSRWLSRHLATLEVTQQSGSLTNRLAAVSKTLRYLQQSAALGIGAWLAVQGEISAGAMIAGTVLATRALAPIDGVVTVWKDVLASRQALARIRSALGPAMATSLRVEEAGVDEPMTLEGVSAWATDEDRPILRDLQLALRPGEVVAVVGASGAGKSTLMRLLVGVWPDARGLIRRPSALLGQGYLPQDVTLYTGSIAENIARMGMPRSEAVLAAAAAVGLHEQILRLPEGYDTVVGDGGLAVNGGLCQRIGLARALYGNPRLVVLDEPGAHLDEAGERSLLDVLKSLRQSGCIVIFVTHAAGLLRAADRIVTLDHGEIVPVPPAVPGVPAVPTTLSAIHPSPC